MSLPAAAAQSVTGVSTSPEEMKRRARDELRAAGIDMGLNKVNRLFVQFRASDPLGDLDEFLLFIVKTVQTKAGQKRAARLSNPDNVRVISYADPTGEQAVRNMLQA
jgi:hypothetical protein